jgi:hypothetical protein
MADKSIEELLIIERKNSYFRSKSEGNSLVNIENRENHRYFPDFVHATFARKIFLRNTQAKFSFQLYFVFFIMLL